MSSSYEETQSHAHETVTTVPRKHQHCIALLMLGMLIASPFLISKLPASSLRPVELTLVDQARSELLIAYAGFPGCSSSCPVALGNLARTYDQLPAASATMLFINVERDSPPSLAGIYARAFHPDFQARTLDQEAASVFYRELGIRSFESARQALAHRNLIYVLRRRNDQWAMVELIDGSESPQRLLQRIRAHLPSARENTQRTSRI